MKKQFQVLDALFLTKESFWNELTEKHPEQMKAFRDWVDQYKKRVGWGDLFNYDSGDINKGATPKYHDLPVAMQIGIFLQFCTETPSRYELIEGMPGSMQLFAECIKAWFAAEHAFKGNILAKQQDDWTELEKEQIQGRIHRKGFYPTPPTVVDKLITDSPDDYPYNPNHPDNFAEN